jgi:hypothetical protein
MVQAFSDQCLGLSRAKREMICKRLLAISLSSSGLSFLCQLAANPSITSGGSFFKYSSSSFGSVGNRVIESEFDIVTTQHNRVFYTSFYFMLFMQMGHSRKTSTRRSEEQCKIGFQPVSFAPSNDAFPPAQQFVVSSEPQAESVVSRVEPRSSLPIRSQITLPTAKVSPGAFFQSRQRREQTHPRRGSGYR